MKKLGFLVSLAIMTACNNTSSSETKADSLRKKVDSVSQKVWDSGNKEVKELKEKIEGQFKKNDSAGK